MNEFEGTRPNSCSQAFARWNQEVKTSRMVLKYFSSGWILMVPKHSLLRYFTLTFTRHKSSKFEGSGPHLNHLPIFLLISRAFDPAVELGTSISDVQLLPPELRVDLNPRKGYRQYTIRSAICRISVLVNTLYPRLSIRYTLQRALQSLPHSLAVSLWPLTREMVLKQKNLWPKKREKNTRGCRLIQRSHHCCSGTGPGCLQLLDSLSQFTDEF